MIREKISRTRNIGGIIAVLLSAVLCISPAAAQPPVSCSQAISRYFNESDRIPRAAWWLNVIGTAVTARGELGFSHFTMENGYRLEQHPLDTPEAARRNSFTAGRRGDAFMGNFHSVFPDRGNTDVDRTSFWIGRSGTLKLRSITWNGLWSQLQNQTCYRGPQDQLVITGHIDNPGFGTDYWTFVMNLNWFKF